MRAAFRRQLEQVGLWFVFLDPSFNAMRAVSQRESATRTAREKVRWLYWRFSGFREQVPVHSAEQEEAMSPWLCQR